MYEKLVSEAVEQHLKNNQAYFDYRFDLLGNNDDRYVIIAKKKNVVILDDSAGYLFALVFENEDTAKDAVFQAWKIAIAFDHRDFPTDCWLNFWRSDVVFEKDLSEHL